MDDVTVEEPIEAVEPEAEVEGAEPAESVEGEETAAEENAPEPVAESEGDGRLLPKSIRALQATDPAAYKQEKARFFQHREFMAAFPEGPTAAKEILKVMADIGGSEGLASMQQRATQLDQITETARTNPAALIDEILQASPGRVEDVAVKAVNAWYQSDPEGYDRMMSGVVAQSLKNIDFDTNMQMAMKFLNRGMTEDAVEILTALQQQTKAFGAAASQPAKPKQQAVDPNEARAKDLDSREAKMFDDSLGQKIISYRDPLIFKEAEQWTKGMTLTDRQKGSLVRDVTSEIGALLQKDAAWMKEYQAAVTKRDSETAFKLYRDKAMKIAPEIVKNVSRELFGSPVTIARKPATAPKPVATAKPAPVPGKKVDPFDAIFNS